MRRPTYVDDTTAEMPAMWYGGTVTSVGLLLAGGGELERAHHVRRDVAVAQHGRLRLAGRPRREQQDGDVVGVEVGHEVAGRDARRATRSRGSSARRPCASRADHVVVDDRRRRRGPRGDAHEVWVGEPVVERREGGARRAPRRTASPGRPAS